MGEIRSKKCEGVWITWVVRVRERLVLQVEQHDEQRQQHREERGDDEPGARTGGLAFTDSDGCWLRAGCGPRGRDLHARLRIYLCMRGVRLLSQPGDVVIHDDLIRLVLEIGDRHIRHRGRAVEAAV